MVWPVRVELTVSTSQTWRPAPRLRPDDWRSKGQRPHGLRGSWRMVFDEHQTSPQQESNPQPRLRGPVSCPLDDEGLRLLRRTVKHPRRFVTVQGQVRSRRSRRGSRTLTGQALDLLPLPDWARRPWSPSPESNRATPSLRGKVTRRSERRGTAGETRTPNSPGLGRRPLPIGLASSPPTDQEGSRLDTARRCSSRTWRRRESNSLDAPCEGGPTPCLPSPRNASGTRRRTPTTGSPTTHRSRGARGSRTPFTVHAMHGDSPFGLGPEMVAGTGSRTPLSPAYGVGMETVSLACLSRRVESNHQRPAYGASAPPRPSRSWGDRPESNRLAA
jgi:hypothetical protein